MEFVFWLALLVQYQERSYKAQTPLTSAAIQVWRTAVEGHLHVSLGGSVGLQSRNVGHGGGGT